MKVAINGLGRIGRQVLRQVQATPGLEIVAVNDLAEAATLALLLNYDSVHGRAAFPIGHGPGQLLLAGRAVPCFREAEPCAPFGAEGAELVLECSGRFNGRESAGHLRDGVRRVILSGPWDDVDLTVLPGVDTPWGDARIISAACPASHALALVVTILDQAFGVGCGLATVVESYRNDQRILDLPHEDLRMARAAAMNMIPTPSQAAHCLGRALPALAGAFQAQAIRVPTPDVSLLDLSVTLKTEVSLDAVHGAFRAAAQRNPGQVALLSDPLVSVDLTGRTESCILDPLLTRILAPRFLKLFAWHDNEAAYAARLIDFCLAQAGATP